MNVINFMALLKWKASIVESVKISTGKDTESFHKTFFECFRNNSLIIVPHIYIYV